MFRNQSFGPMRSVERKDVCGASFVLKTIPGTDYSLGMHEDIFKQLPSLFERSDVLSQKIGQALHEAKKDSEESDTEEDGAVEWLSNFQGTAARLKTRSKTKELLESDDPPKRRIVEPFLPSETQNTALYARITYLLNEESETTVALQEAIGSLDVKAIWDHKDFDARAVSVGSDGISLIMNHD